MGTIYIGNGASILNNGVIRVAQLNMEWPFRGTGRRDVTIHMHKCIGMDSTRIKRPLIDSICQCVCITSGVSNVPRCASLKRGKPYRARSTTRIGFYTGTPSQWPPCTEEKCGLCTRVPRADLPACHFRARKEDSSQQCIDTARREPIQRNKKRAHEYIQIHDKYGTWLP